MADDKSAARRVAEESNPVGFIRRLKGLPLVKKVLRIFDRFL